MTKRGLRLVVVVGLLLAAVTLLVAFSMKETMVYYVTVSELKEGDATLYSRGLRVSGIVVEGSLVQSDTGLEATFRLSDGEDVVPVSYGGILPDTFKEGEEVLVEGRYRRDGVFVASQVFTKCASKYEPEAPTEGSSQRAS